MSVYRVASMACGACARSRSVKLVDSANPLRHPPFMDEVLERTFHRFMCPSCQHVDVVDGPLLWTQVTADLVAWVVPERARLAWQQVEVDALARLENPVRHEGPAFVQAWGKRARLRVVFGLEELRDKVVCRNAQLDDRIVEVLKLPHADLDTGGGVVLEAVTGDGLVLATPAPADVTGDHSGDAGPDDRTLAVVGWPAYERAVGQADALAAEHPGLFSGAWVHHVRAPFAAAPAVV